MIFDDETLYVVEQDDPGSSPRTILELAMHIRREPDLDMITWQTLSHIRATTIRLVTSKTDSDVYQIIDDSNRSFTFRPATLADWEHIRGENGKSHRDIESLRDAFRDAVSLAG